MPLSLLEKIEKGFRETGDAGQAINDLLVDIQRGKASQKDLGGLLESIQTGSFFKKSEPKKPRDLIKDFGILEKGPQSKDLLADYGVLKAPTEEPSLFEPPLDKPTAKQFIEERGHLPFFWEVKEPVTFGEIYEFHQKGFKEFAEKRPEIIKYAKFSLLPLWETWKSTQTGVVVGREEGLKKLLREGTGYEEKEFTEIPEVKKAITSPTGMNVIKNILKFGAKAVMHNVPLSMQEGMVKEIDKLTPEGALTLTQISGDITAMGAVIGSQALFRKYLVSRASTANQVRRLVSGLPKIDIEAEKTRIAVRVLKMDPSADVAQLKRDIDSWISHIVARSKTVGPEAVVKTYEKYLRPGALEKFILEAPPRVGPPPTYEGRFFAGIPSRLPAKPTLGQLEKMPIADITRYIGTSIYTQFRKKHPELQKDLSKIESTKDIVEKTGVTWEGVGDFVTPKGKVVPASSVWFTDPQTGSSLSLHIDKVTPEAVKQKLEVSRKAFEVEALPAKAPEEIIGNLPKEGVVVANIGVDGKIYVGDKGDLHFNISQKHALKIRKKENLQPGEPTWKDIGFIGKDGKFLTREEALTRTKVRPTTTPGELDAKDLQEQTRQIISAPPTEAPEVAEKIPKITKEVGGIKLPITVFKDVDAAHEATKGEGWEQVSALWEENLKEEEFLTEFREGIEEGYEHRLIRFKARKEGKRGLYRNYAGKLQKEPVYTYWLQRRKVAPPTDFRGELEKLGYKKEDIAAVEGVVRDLEKKEVAPPKPTTKKALQEELKKLDAKREQLGYYQNAVQIEQAQKDANEILAREPKFDVEGALEDGWGTDDFSNYLDSIKKKPKISKKKIVLPAYEEFKSDLTEANPFYKQPESKWEDIWDREITKIFKREEAIKIQLGVLKAPAELPKAKPKTLTGEIKARGGLDPKKLAKDYNVKELREFGLGHILKKGGGQIDDIAQQLQAEGILFVPEDMNPGDYLMEQLKSKEARVLPAEKGEQVIAKKYYKHLDESETLDEEIEKVVDTPRIIEETPLFRAALKLGAEWRTADGRKMTTTKALASIKKTLGEGRYKITGGEKPDEILIEEIVPAEALPEQAQKVRKEGVARLREELRSERLKTIADQLTKLAEIAPHLVTPKQQAYAHILKDQKMLTDRQYRRLMRIFAGKRTMAYRTPTGKIKKRAITKEEAKEFIEAEKGVVSMPGRKPVISMSKALTPPGFFDRKFREPTLIKYIYPSDAYARWLGVYELLEPAIKAKMKLGLEKQKMFKWVDDLESEYLKFKKVPLSAKIKGLIKNKPVAALVELYDRLDDPNFHPALLSGQELNTFLAIRHTTETMLKRTNEIREIYGLEPIRTLKGYIRHIFDTLAREDISQKYPMPEELKWILPKIKTKHIYNPTAFRRMGREEGLLRDPFKALKAMIAIDLRQIYLEGPNFLFKEQITALGKGVTKEGLPVIPANTRRWAEDYINQVIKGYPTEFDKLTDATIQALGIDKIMDFFLKPFGRSFGGIKSLSGGIGRLVHDAVIWGRIKLGMRNHTQKMLGLGLYGTKSFIKAMGPENAELRALIDNSLFYQVSKRTFMEEMPKDVLGKLEKIGFAPYGHSHAGRIGGNVPFTMKQAYHASKELVTNPKYKKYGWTMEDVAKEMEHGATTAQYWYNLMGMPELYRHGLLKVLARLQSWWMNYTTKYWGEMLYRMFYGKTGWGKPVPPKWRAGAFRHIVASLVFIEGVRRAFGLNYRQIALMGVLPAYLSPAGQLAMGLYKLMVADTDWEKATAKRAIAQSWRAFIPGSGAWRDVARVWRGEKPLKYLFFHTEREAATAAPFAPDLFEEYNPVGKIKIPDLMKEYGITK